MNSNVCLVALVFLSFENVAGFISGSSSASVPLPIRDTNMEQQDSIKKPELQYHYEGTSLNLSCESAPEHYHQWYQRNDERNFQIGIIPLQEGVTKTRYNITVEKFDNNTRIYCKSTKDKDTVNKSQSLVSALIDYIPDPEHFKTKINVPKESHKPIQEPTKLTYSKTKKASFSCEEYENKTPYLGIINTSNIITTYETKTWWTRRIDRNGSILCCIYYEVQAIKEEKWITRFVVKKTLLIYEDEVWFDAINFVGGISNITDPDNQAIIIYSTAAVAVVFILLVIMVIFCKKRCRKKSISDTKVQYVDLDIIRTEPGTFQRPAPEEESPYAEIIGVMRPSSTIG